MTVLLQIVILYLLFTALVTFAAVKWEREEARRNRKEAERIEAESRSEAHADSQFAVRTLVTHK